jgi:hypothetical protein
LNVELLCDSIYKPLLALSSFSDNRYVLHHSSVAHDIGTCYQAVVNITSDALEQQWTWIYT